MAWSCHLPDTHWLVLEDIPHPLPVPALDRWRPDPRVVAVLARLHRTTRDWALDTLARDIALAKVAAVTMLLRAHADAVARVPDDYIMWLIERIPSWVQSLR